MSKGNWPPRPKLTEEQLAAQRERREDGQAPATPAIMLNVCRHCGADIPVRAKGRPREFCGPAHRVAWHRAQQAGS